jgi:transposase-like protein
MPTSWAFLYLPLNQGNNMKFNNLNDLILAAEALPKAKSNPKRKLTTRAFRHAYVDYCKQVRVPMNKFAKYVNVSDSATYVWSVEYARHMSQVKPDAIRVLQDEIAELETKLTTLNDQLALLEKLEGLGYKITKE